MWKRYTMITLIEIMTGWLYLYHKSRFHWKKHIVLYNDKVFLWMRHNHKDLHNWRQKFKSYEVKLTEL